MHIAPNELPVNVNIPNSERKIFDLLLDVELEGKSLALWSVLLPQHIYNNNGEIDFLILTTKGLIILEVKGGRIRHQNGTWIFTDRYGVEHRRKRGPFAQAKEAGYTLLGKESPLNFPDKLLKAGVSTKTLVWGFAVVMPDITFDAKSAEWTEAQVIDQNDVATPNKFARALKRVIDEAWTSAKNSHSKDRGQHPKELKPEEMAKIFKALRGSFDVIPQLGDRTKTEEYRLLQATEEQYDFLDACAPLPGLTNQEYRLLCTGGAGTGKTFLAVETARRKAASGLSVNIVCFSQPLAAFIALQKGMENDLIKVAPISQTEGLPKADYLIVDEGQDLMNAENLSTLGDLVKEGLEKGNWAFFFDANFQVGVLGSFDQSAYEELNRYSTNTQTLTKNCRNTKKIVAQVSDTLGIEMEEHEAIEGIPVTEMYFESVEEAAENLQEKITYLLNEGIQHEEITVLTRCDPADDEIISALSGSITTKFETMTQNNAASPPVGRIQLARIDLYKGLENRYVFVLASNSNASTTLDGIKNELYVGMTRAQIGLYLVLDSDLKPEIQALNETNV
jgi:hypothetical protein